MKVKVLNQSMTQVDYELNGEFKNGSFYYAESTQTASISNLFGLIGRNDQQQQSKIPIDYKVTIKEPKERIAYVIYDGKEYKQVAFTGVKVDTSQSYRDYMRDVKLTELIKQSMIQKPQNQFKELMEFLAFGLVVAAAFGLWYTGNHMATQYAPLLKVLNQSLQQFVISNQHIANLTQVIASHNYNGTLLPHAG